MAASSQNRSQNDGIATLENLIRTIAETQAAENKELRELIAKSKTDIDELVELRLGQDINPVNNLAELLTPSWDRIQLGRDLYNALKTAGDEFDKSWHDQTHGIAYPVRNAKKYNLLTPLGWLAPGRTRVIFESTPIRNYPWIFEGDNDGRQVNMLWEHFKKKLNWKESYDPESRTYKIDKSDDTNIIKTLGRLASLGRWYIAGPLFYEAGKILSSESNPSIPAYLLGGALIAYGIAQGTILRGFPKIYNYKLADFGGAVEMIDLRQLPIRYENDRPDTIDIKFGFQIVNQRIFLKKFTPWDHVKKDGQFDWGNRYSPAEQVTLQLTQEITSLLASVNIDASWNSKEHIKLLARIINASNYGQLVDKEMKKMLRREIDHDSNEDSSYGLIHNYGLKVIYLNFSKGQMLPGIADTAVALRAQELELGYLKYALMPLLEDPNWPKYQELIETMIRYKNTGELAKNPNYQVYNFDGVPSALQNALKLITGGKMTALYEQLTNPSKPE